MMSLQKETKTAGKELVKKQMVELERMEFGKSGRKNKNQGEGKKGRR